MNFRFSFEELSLLSQNGFNLRLEANGYAVIEYQEDGYWRIGEIWLDASKPAGHQMIGGAYYGAYDWSKIQITREEYPHYYRDICMAVEEKYSADIQDRIREELASLDISIPDPNREHLEVSAS